MVSVWLLTCGWFQNLFWGIFFEWIIGRLARCGGARNFHDNDLEVVSHTDRPKYLIGLYYWLVFTLPLNVVSLTEFSSGISDITLKSQATTISPTSISNNAAQYENSGLQQTITILPDLSYNLTFWARSEDPYICEFYSLLADYYIGFNEFTSYSGQGWQQFSRAYTGGTATEIEL